MRSGITLVVATLAVWLSMHSQADACSCVVPDFRRSYQYSEHVVRVDVLASLGVFGGQRRYLAVTSGKSYKGCLAEQRAVIVRTASDSAACGVTLDVGSQNVLYAQDGGSFLGLKVLQIGLCDSNSVYDELATDHRRFLDTRYTSCGRESGCVASDEVQCFVDPCQVSSCDVEGAVCSANYCGGCNAEWSDAEGSSVCLPVDACDNPDRRYVGENPEICSRIDFRCEVGEASFSDECGCGCQQQRSTVLAPCRLGGCSGQLCLGPDSPDRVTTCEVRPEYACYRSAVCEAQASGACGWTETAELEACLDATTQR
jgi:hypothetical protein